MIDLYFVFDVESIGLHGDGFAYGYVVVDQGGKEHAAGYLACDPLMARGSLADRAWVTENVFPALPDFSEAERSRLYGPDYLRTMFWNVLRDWKARGAFIFADCGWPVEARFLSACVDVADYRQSEGPYPLHDVATVLLCAGMDPLHTYDRLPEELPVHNPLRDARQSARLLTMALRTLTSAMLETGGFPK